MSSESRGTYEDVWAKTFLFSIAMRSAGKPVETSSHPDLTVSHNATALYSFQSSICSLIAYRNKIFHPAFPNG